MGKIIKFGDFCEGCDQNGDRVSKNDKCCLICIKWLKSCFSELWKIWDSVYLWMMPKCLWISQIWEIKWNIVEKFFIEMMPDFGAPEHHGSSGGHTDGHKN